MRGSIVSQGALSYAGATIGFVLFCFVAVKVRDYRVGAGEKVAYSVGEFA